MTLDFNDAPRQRQPDDFMAFAPPRPEHQHQWSAHQAPPPTQDTMLAAALELAARGWPVFPCQTRGKDAKRPFTPHGFKDASTDPGTIRNWWSRWPGAAICVPTGPAINAFVLDVDLPKGPDSLKALEAAHGPLPATTTQRTGSGGLQYFFRWPGGVEVRNSAGKLGPGLDVRGQGGYVILPPSPHPSGGTYQWIINGTPPADAPAWLLDLITKATPEHKQAQAKGRPATGQGTTAYGRKALEDECSKVAMTAQGGRNDALNTAALKVGRLVAGQEIEEQDAWAALLDAAARCALVEGEAQKTIQSGLEAGKQEPRTAPEKSSSRPRPSETPDQDEDAWSLAREQLPRSMFPWEVLPRELEASLKQLAVSMAGSPNPLPGAACCLLAAALGRTVGVLAKESWLEPLIFWHFDMRSSGQGKTSPLKALAGPLRTRQEREHKRFEKELETWNSLKPKDRKEVAPPPQARGFFSTDTTIEGLHQDLKDHPTGGIAIILSEASSLISSQGAYKAGKGADRESWLALWDGHPARIVRAGKQFFLAGGRVQVCGGVQPETFKRVFSSENGLYLHPTSTVVGTFSTTLHDNHLKSQGQGKPNPEKL